jgi:hypothetical protein
LGGVESGEHVTLLMSIVGLILMVSVGGCAVTPAARNTPSETVVLYRTAVVERDGPEAVSYLSRDTLSLYLGIRKSALCAPKASLRFDPLFERLTALLFRHVADPEFLREATVEQLAAYVIREAWLTGPHLSETTVVNVEYYDGYAIVQAKFGDASDSYLRLVQEAGFWKIDLRPVLRQNNDALARRLRSPNEDAVLLIAVERITGSRPTDDIWQPPLAGHLYCLQ